MVKHSLVELLKPNVIIYLDAPPEVVSWTRLICQERQ